MKNIFLFLLLTATISCNAQTIYPLRTFTEIPDNAYLKDTNNELIQYVGTWKGTWEGKTLFVTFKKITNKYDEDLGYYKDQLIGRFKVIDANGFVRYDNTSLPDNLVKIIGGKFRKLDDKYSLIYIDRDLCNTSGNIWLSFTTPTKTELNWELYFGSNMINESCEYYNTNPFPSALPKQITLTKQ